MEEQVINIIQNVLQMYSVYKALVVKTNHHFKSDFVIFCYISAKKHIMHSM